jgi:hypothetical protein
MSEHFCIHRECAAPDFLDSFFDYHHAAASRASSLSPSLPRGLEAEPFQQPVDVVPLAEFLKRSGQLLQRDEVPHPKQLFLEDAEESLDAAVAFRLPDKGGTRSDAEKGDLILEAVAHELRAVIMPGSDAAGHAFGEAAELLVHRAADRFQRLESRAALGDGNARDSAVA